MCWACTLTVCGVLLLLLLSSTTFAAAAAAAVVASRGRLPPSQTSMATVRTWFLCRDNRALQLAVTTAGQPDGAQAHRSCGQSAQLIGNLL
jgi:hypothetical protein